MKGYIKTRFHTKKKKEETDDIPQKLLLRHNYTDDPELLANTPAQARYLMPNLDQSTGGIGLFVNSDKTEFTRFNPDITLLSQLEL